MAKMVHEGLFVGTGGDIYKFAGSILHAAKDPWYLNDLHNTTYYHNHGICLPNVLIFPNAIQSSYNEMSLNMVDADDPKYFPDDMINVGLDFITERFAEGDPVLVHCNMGVSRSPSLAFLWMYEHGFLDDDFRYAVPQFRDLYKDWFPGNGIWAYLKNRCKKEST